MIRRLSPPHKLAAMPRETREQLVKLRRGMVVGLMSEEGLRLGAAHPNPYARAIARLELKRREQL